MKVAKLVTVSITTRVVVEDNDTEEQVAQKALPQAVRGIEESGVFDCVTSIQDDTEVPFGTLNSDKHIK